MARTPPFCHWRIRCKSGIGGIPTRVTKSGTAPSERIQTLARCNDGGYRNLAVGGDPVTEARYQTAQQQTHPWLDAVVRGCQAHPSACAAWGF